MDDIIDNNVHVCVGYNVYIIIFKFLEIIYFNNIMSLLFVTTTKEYQVYLAVNFICYYNSSSVAECFLLG